MLPMWDQWGERFAVTALHLDRCYVTAVKNVEQHGYTSLQLSVGEMKPSRYKFNSKVVGQYTAANVAPGRKLMEFRVTPDCLLERGTQLRALHFVPGQVCVCIIYPYICLSV